MARQTISLRFTSAVGSLKVDKLHTTVFDISPGKYNCQVKQLKQDKRGCHKNKYTYLIEQVLFFRCGKSRIRQQKIFY
jgi:hypothetical protein